MLSGTPPFPQKTMLTNDFCHNKAATRLNNKNVFQHCLRVEGGNSLDSSWGEGLNVTQHDVKPKYSRDVVQKKET